MSPAKKQAESPSLAPQVAPWSALARIAVSLLVVFHLTAVVIAPFPFATNTRPGVSSPASDVVINVTKPYIDATFLNHGYFFFAPNPGPSHLVDYEVQTEQGSVTGRFPDRSQQWPRLLYHRHFMLSETLNTNFVPSQPPPVVANDPEMLALWTKDRNIYFELRKSFENRLKTQYSGSSVELRRVEHRPPDWFEVFVQKYSLTDERLYQVLPEELPIAVSNPVQPNPVQPNPVQPNPVQPNPVQPGPVQPGPVQPGPVQPGPVQPGPLLPFPERVSPEGTGGGQGVLRPGGTP